MLNANKLTEKSVEAVSAAQSIAIEHNHQQIEQAHLLLALLKQQNGLIPGLITKMGTDREVFTAAVEKAVKGLPAVTGSGREADKVYISQDVDRALTSAEKEAERMKDEYISVEHLFLGLLEIQTFACFLTELMKSFGHLNGGGYAVKYGNAEFFFKSCGDFCIDCF